MRFGFRCKVEKFLIKKRKGRSKTIMDLDDFLILKTLGSIRHLDQLKKVLNLSHNALLVHLKRLEHQGWIKIVKCNLNYKAKDILKTIEGRDILDKIKPPL